MIFAFAIKRRGSCRKERDGKRSAWEEGQTKAKRRSLDSVRAYILLEGNVVGGSRREYNRTLTSRRIGTSTKRTKLPIYLGPIGIPCPRE